MPAHFLRPAVLPALLVALVAPCGGAVPASAQSAPARPAPEQPAAPSLPQSAATQPLPPGAPAPTVPVAPGPSATPQAAPAAGPVTGDPVLIARILAELGLPVRQGRDVQGLPLLESRVDGMLFNIYFYDCTGTCRRIQFVTGFRLSQPMTAEDANDWNRDTPMAKVVVTEAGQPYVSMDIGVAADGIGRKNFEDALATWRVVLADFRAAITN